MTVAAPSAMGVVLPRSGFNITGRPQAVADFSTTRGVRISGNGLTNFWGVQASTGDPGTEPAFSVRGPTGRIFTYYVPVIPTNIDPRLGIMASTFQYFAFRSLTLTYVPACGTNTINSIAFGVGQDSELYLRFPFPTQQQVLEVNAATLTPFWQTASVTYSHSGSKTWLTALPDSGETGSANDFYQAQIMGSANNFGALGVRGFFYVSYVIDLYEPSPVPTNLSGALNPANGLIGQPCRPCCHHHHDPRQPPDSRDSDEEKEEIPCHGDHLPPKPPVLSRAATELG